MPPPPGQALIKINPNERIIQQAKSVELINLETDIIKKLTIFENGVALGITIGLNSKSDVLKYVRVIFEP